MNKIQLEQSNILNVPLQTYCNDFTFIVNGQEFKTTRLISELLSPKICLIHRNDPTFNTFTIETRQKGDFSLILKLVNFKENIYSDDELAFITDVIDQLGSENIQIESKFQTKEITEENVFMLILQHEKSRQFYSKQLQLEIDFISSHMSQLIEKQLDEFQELSEDTLIRIIDNPKLKLKDEDQLLSFIIGLYSSSSFKYINFFDFVIFKNVSSEMMKEFLEIFNMNDLTSETWRNLSERLQQDLKPKRFETVKRYEERGKKFIKNNEFSGIINFLMEKSNDKIDNEINITSSSLFSNNDRFHPRNVAFQKNSNNFFESANSQDSWICFDFKDRLIVPTDYAIRSADVSHDNHLKSWVVECSSDKRSWEVVDEETNCSFLNGASQSHTFSIKNNLNKEYKCLRIRQTGPNWINQHYLKIESVEIFGTLI